MHRPPQKRYKKKGEQTPPSNNNNQPEKTENKQKTENNKQQKTTSVIPKKKLENLTQDKHHHNHQHDKHHIKKNNNSNNNRNVQDIIDEASRGHTQLSMEMINLLFRNQYQCLICWDNIKKNDYIWSCSFCLRLYHVSCIQKWRNKSIEGVVKGIKWTCPGCRHELEDVPDATCLCGKSDGKPEESDMNQIPHSCGETCGKFRVNTNCPHPCSLICHPGPCPPCSAVGPEKECFCGNSIYRTLCGVIDHGRSCGEVCGKILNCGKHCCEENCHSDNCENCNREILQKCYCGKYEKNRFCGTEEEIDNTQGDKRTFSCKEICNRLLSCGNHRCQELCHTGNCKKCALLPEELKTCACGKTETSEFNNQRKSCLDPVSTCDKICEKKKLCGHNCKLKCHQGECETQCNESVNVYCACGNISKVISCQEKKDNYEKIKEEFRCNKVCRKKLSCGYHHCTVKCCPSENPDHLCRIPCKKTLNCGNHQCSLFCHKGNCHPCFEVTFDDRNCRCGKTLWKAPIKCGEIPPFCSSHCEIPTSCGHPSFNHLCHWSGKCPPCAYLVEKTCLGGHVQLTVQCSMNNVCCGQRCNKPLQCGEHTNCQRLCHGGKCEIENEQNDPKSCGQKCSKVKPCSHKCDAICHPGVPCPEEVCNKKIRIYCECKRIFRETICSNREDITVNCDKKCEEEKKNKRIKDLYGTTDITQYSEFLLKIGQFAPQFISELEKFFLEFISSTAVFIKYNTNDHIKRKITHDYARFFKLKTNYHSKEYNKPIEVKKKYYTKEPNVLLSRILKYHDDIYNGNILYYNLNYRITQNNLKNIMSDYKDQYTLFWIDEKCSIAAFKEKELVEKLLKRLEGNMLNIKAKQYNELEAPFTKQKQNVYSLNPGKKNLKNEDKKKDENAEAIKNPYDLLQVDDEKDNEKDDPDEPKEEKDKQDANKDQPNDTNEIKDEKN